jgi:flavorubredoxin
MSMKVQLAENVYWVGAVDKDVRNFHGYKTPFGTTYNAYLIIDEKITLIDSVKAPFAGKLIENIREIVDPAKIDVIISNHVEPDHSGSLGEVLKYAKNAVMYTSANGEKGLRSYYKSDWPFRLVKTGDSISTGKYTFSFLLMPLLHWPDSMATYSPELKILFPNDAFGQHFASDFRFNDETTRDFIFDRAADYYANIILPFDTQVKKALAAIDKMDVRMIGPSHGLVWRTDIDAIRQKYAEWADNTCDDRLMVIVYDSMWGATRILAERLEEEYKGKGYTVRVYDLKNQHISEAMAGLLEAKIIAVGSSTLNRHMLPTVAAFLTYMQGLAPKNRIGQAFGSYGWSGESIGDVEKMLADCGFTMLPQIKAQWMP